MRIQQQNSYNPNLKALYFTKCKPESASYELKQGYVYAASKIQYIKDESAKLTPIIKEAIAESKFIKDFAKTRDVFVNYLGEKFNPNFNAFTSAMEVYVVTDAKTDNFRYMPYFAEDKYTPEGARLKLFAQLDK